MVGWVCQVLADIPGTVTALEGHVVRVLVLDGILHLTPIGTLDAVLHALLDRVGEGLREPSEVGPFEFKTTPCSTWVPLIELVKVTVPATVVVVNRLGVALRLHPERSGLTCLAHIYSLHRTSLQMPGPI